MHLLTLHTESVNFVSAVLQEPRLPSIVETKGDISDDSFHLSPATRSRRNLLLPNFSSPVRRTSLGNLLGDELRQFNALRHCRSPNLSRGVHGQSSPQPPSKKEHSTPTVTPPSASAQGESGAEQKPAKLLIPTVTCFGPPDLSPRYIFLSKWNYFLNRKLKYLSCFRILKLKRVSSF